MILSEAVIGRASQGSRVLVFRGADHGMQMSEGGFSAEPVPSKQTYAPGYFSAMTTWITNDFKLEGAIPGQLDEAEILAAAESEAIRSPHASIASHFLTRVSLLALIFLAAVVAIGVKPLLRCLKVGRYGELLGQTEKIAWRWFTWVSLLNVFSAVSMILTALILLSFSASSAGALDNIVILVTIFSLVASALSIYTIYRFAAGPQRAHAFRIHGNLARIVLLGLTAFPLFSLSWFIG